MESPSVSSDPGTSTATDLDALRAFAMLLGIVLHGLLSFINTPLWPAQDRYPNDEVYGLALHAIHGFRMQLFFLISGFFTAMLWRRRGLAVLLQHRALRIVLPMILGVIVTWPLVIGVVVWPPKLLYYAIFFGFGALCFGKPFFEKGAGRHWWLWFVLSVPILLAGVHILELRNEPERGGKFWQHHALSGLCAVVYAWMMIFAFIGFFRRFFHTESRRMRYLSDSAYWLYLAHLPLIMAVQILVSDWQLPSLLKLLIICVSVTGLLLLIYEIAGRYTWIGALLYGRKTRAEKAGVSSSFGGPSNTTVSLLAMSAGIIILLPTAARSSEHSEASANELGAVPTPATAPAIVGPAPVPVADIDTDLPLPLTADHFRELKEKSPFTRALNLAETLRLTGVARVDGKPVATLLDRETKKTYVISEVPNPQGWKLVDVAAANGAALSAVSATISIGGEMVTVHYDERQLNPQPVRKSNKRPPPGTKDNRPAPTDEEKKAFGKMIGEKWKKLNKEQQDQAKKVMGEKMKANPKLSDRQRGEMISGIVDYVKTDRAAADRARGSGK